MKIIVIMAVFIALSIGSTAYAAEIPSVHSGIRRDPEEMTAEEIIMDLYSLEPSSEIKRFAKESTMIMTGELPVLDYWGEILIGTYEDSSVFYHSHIAAVLGTDDLLADIRGEYYTMLFPSQDHPTPAQIEQNRKALCDLYNMVWDIKESTAVMTERERVYYIGDYLLRKIEIETMVPGRIATRLQLGSGDCDVFSGLFYLTAMNCGIKVRAVAGHVPAGAHGWNEVCLDDSWYLVDVILGQYFLDSEEAAYHGYQPGYITTAR